MSDVLPIPEYPETDFKMIMKSFINALPQSQLWLGTRDKGGLIMLGSEAPISHDRARVAERLKEKAIRDDLAEIDKEFVDDKSFWKLYLGEGSGQRAYLADSPEITDDFPRLEYPYFRSKTPAYVKHPAVLAGN